MLFSSITFLYYFLPITLAIYFITPMWKDSPILRNYVLLIASLVFYAWGEPVYVLLMLGMTFAAWAFGLIIDGKRGHRLAHLAFVASICVSLSGLMFVKYADFFLLNLGRVSSVDLPLLGIALPIGVSFYTFQIMSYTIDLKLGNIPAQRSFFLFAVYVTLFPQLVAGPIIRYKHIAASLEKRNHSLADISSGVSRFVYGLAKKVLLANSLGNLAKLMQESGDQSVSGTWLYLIAFTLQIYFDFSGYSDMAIGLGRMFGLHFLENFNYPYISRSITEFWRRWHISLSSWFRDYVYIPLGGNRVGKVRFCINILVVWGLTGFWHGADWNFILWGLYYAILLFVEKLFLKERLTKLPAVVNRVYVVILVMLSWVLFDASDLTSALQTFRSMFGGSGQAISSVSLYYLRSYGITLMISIIAATPKPKQSMQRLREARPSLMTVLEPLSMAFLLLLVTANLVEGSYNPFIYFRF